MADEDTTPPADAGSDTPAGQPAEAPGSDTPPESGKEGPKSMLEAVDAGIADAGDGAPLPNADDAEPAADAPAPPAAEPDKPPAKPATDKGTPKPDAAKPEAEKPPKEPKPKEPKEPPQVIDPINDPIPPEVKGRTRERMTQLITNVKEVSAERDHFRGQFNEILGIIQETRSTPEQYGQALDYLRAVNSGDPAQIKVAIQTVQRELNALAAMIGEPVPGVDLLSQHQDLRDAVNAGNLTEQHANEIAAGRAMRTTQQVQGQRVREQRQTEVVVQTAQAALNRAEDEFRRTDPLYEQKKAMLVPMLKPIFESLPPQQWDTAFRSAYSRLQLPASAVVPPSSRGAPPPAPIRPAGHQPLRALQPAGDSRREASSMLDAINAGIDAASSRR